VAEPVRDRAAMRTDILYTLMHRLGLFGWRCSSPSTAGDGCSASCAWRAAQTFQLDALWPGVTDLPWVSLALYLVVFDLWATGCTAPSTSGRWWRLHALHHAAPDDDVERQPQPPARRPAERRHLVLVAS
jgi:hypothetical protein